MADEKETEAEIERSFKDVAKDSLKRDEPYQFQKSFKSKLDAELATQSKKLFEIADSDIDTEMSVVSSIQGASRSYGASDISYSEGAIVLTVPNKQAALDLVDYLEKNDDVDSYDLEGVEDEDTDLAGDAIDLDELSEEVGMQFEFTIYINPDLVQLSPDDMYDFDDDSGALGESKIEENSNDEEELTYIGAERYLLEIKRKIVVRGAKKIIKIQCAKGQKWSPKQKKCIKISSQELRARRKGAMKGARKRKTKLVQTNKKRALSMKKRTSMGLQK